MKQIRRLLAILLISCCSLATFATEVPRTIQFAGMTLTLSEGTRRKIQEDVDKLQRYGPAFQAKVETADMYFPIIEKIFAEEGLPDDFKFLAIQESALISDAVSTSNAVGYWQFKKESALEVGLVVNREVDERKHIVMATRGAARYLKRNNYFLKNWVFALLSYNVGLGGSKSLINHRDIGVAEMHLTERTHWYVLKFLAHKIAFGDAVGKNKLPKLTLLQHADCKGKSLRDIATQMETPLEQLELYNKWLSRSRVPEDRDYILIIPAPAEKLPVLLAKLDLSPATPESTAAEAPIVASEYNLNAAYPVLKRKKVRNRRGEQAVFYTANGKPGIQAQPGDQSTELAQLVGISREKFLQYNDLQATDKLISGEVYYLKKKRSKAKVYQHVVTEGETLWQISQKYAITLRALLRKNRMKRPAALRHGQVVWLRYIRPADEPIEYRNIPRPADEVKSPGVVVQTTKKPVEKPVNPPVETAIPKQTTVEPITQTDVQQDSTEKPDSVTISTDLPPSPDSVIVSQIPSNGPGIEWETEETNSLPVTEEPETPVTETAQPKVAAETSQPSQPARQQMHVVTTGQTLYAIAKLYHVSVAQLREWNNLRETDGINVAQTLIVGHYSITTRQPEFIEYIVRTGDTLYKIARTHGVMVADLQKWNNKTDANVAVGEKLKIRKVDDQ